MDNTNAVLTDEALLDIERRLREANAVYEKYKDDEGALNSFLVPKVYNLGREVENLLASHRALQAERDALQQWKQSALQVISEHQDWLHNSPDGKAGDNLIDVIRRIEAERDDLKRQVEADEDVLWDIVNALDDIPDKEQTDPFFQSYAQIQLTKWRKLPHLQPADHEADADGKGE